MIFPNLPLYDYFAVVGYNPEFGLKQERRDEFGEGNSPNGPRSPLEASYEAKVIVHFPRERQGKPFASEIASLALPCGVRLFTEQNVPREPSFHSFVIVREDGSRLYGCSLVFYEELRSVELRQQIFDAQMYFLRDFASNYASTSSFSSESPTDSPYSKGTLLQQKQHLLKKFTAHSLPRKFSTSSVRRNSSNVNSSDQKNVEDHSSYYSNPKSLLFASKCMVVLTPLPVIYSSENLLHNFWLIFNDKFSVESSLSLDDALFWTLFQIPLPPPGESIRVTHPKFQLLVRIPTPDDFPYFDYPMETIFNFLSIEKFLKLLTNFLLEKQILLVSKHARTLMLFGECLSALVFPFSWQMAYCPILPHSQLKFLEAPVPWLMGLCYEDENLPEDFSQFNICFLDIDTRRLDLPEDLPAFPKSQQIINSINVLLNEFTDKEIELTSSNKNKKQIHDFYLRGLSFNKALRSIFLSHFASLFTSYENYLLNADINTNCDNIKNSRTTGRSRSARILRESSANFDKISFLVDQPESVLPFLSAFLETQMFTSFIDSKILSLQNSAQAGNGISIFDQKIAELKDIGIVENNLISVKNSEVTSLSDAKIHQISPPTSSKIPPQKYNGFLLISDPSLLEQNESTIMDNLSDGVGSSPLSISNKHCSIKTTNELKKPRINKLDNEDKETSSTNTLIIHENDGTTPMNMAHQNWKFVDQLLKETKAKTKRILVAKMGKEAIHLGHGQLHLGISGVEENTLVASFCDLLERIWSHGLKKKQGKSALWSYIIAYHEWEKRINNNNNKESSRRSSSIGFENNNINNNISLSTHEKEQLPSTTPNEILQNINNGESPKALLELIASFRKIAVPSPSMDSLDNSPHSSSTDSLSNITNNWSQSLLRAANVICETLQQKTNNEKIRKKERNNSKGRLPPLPPQQMDQTSIQNWRINTPKLLRRQKSSEFNEQNEESDDLLNKKSSENNSQVKETYRKFIFQSPLKTVNNNQEERKSRSITKIPTPPRSSSCCQSGGKGNLASRFSEDSLSCISSKNNPSTPKRRPRDLSTSGGLTNFQSQKCQYSRNRSLSRSNSPSRLYEKLTRGMLGGSGRGGLERSLSPLPNTMVYDLKNIVRMTEIKTDIGFARAFVRIALERKLLYQYLKKLLSNTQLLQKLYKRYSLLRCDDEREQFLFHLLSLNAVDFSCFTNTFLTIKMRYQVLMVCGLNRFPDSFVYIVLTGSLGYTSQISLPANNTQFTFDHKNLGILSTLRVGHKINSERSNHRPIKWFLDYVLVRNCVTAQTFYFRCARWFGRGIDDGALERLLVAEAIVLHPVDEDQEEGINSNNNYYSESPLPNAFLSPRKSNKYYDTSDNSSFQLKNQQRPKISLRSPSCERKLFGLTDNLTEMNNGKDEILGGLDTLQSLEHKTGMAVNALMKHFLTIGECGEQQQFIGNNNAKLSLLLCSNDGGLLSCFNEIFSHGLIQKMFQTIYPWDYVEKVFIWFGQFFRNGEAKKLTREQRSLIIYAYKMIEKISGHSVVGKEGKFNLFMLLCLRDHIFSGLIPLIVWTPITTQFYEQRAFIRNTSKLSYLVKLVGSLNEFQFDYEQSLTHGLVF